MHSKTDSFTLQVSVESGFSALALILSKTRMQLSRQYPAVEIECPVVRIGHSGTLWQQVIN